MLTALVLAVAALVYAGIIGATLALCRAASLADRQMEEAPLDA